MKCKLEKQIDHNRIREQFRRTYIQCPLLEREDKGMTSFGIVCGGCCIRFQMLNEAKADLILRQIITKDDYKRNPDLIEEHLPEVIKEYYRALNTLGKTLDDVASECNRCKPEPIEGRQPNFTKATEMTECGKNDWK